MKRRYDWVVTGEVPEGQRQGNEVLLKRLAGYVRPHAGHLALAGFCMLGVAAATSGQAVLIKNVLDDVLIAKNREALVLVPLAVLVISLLKGVFSYGQSILMAFVGGRVLKQFQDQLYAHVIRLSYGFFAEVPVGALISRIAGDVAAIRATVTSLVTGLIKDTFSIVGLVIVVFYMDWQLALITLALAPPVVWFIVAFGRRIRGISRASAGKQAEMTARLDESLTGVRVVKAFNNEEGEARRFRGLTRNIFDLYLRVMRTAALSHPVMEFLGAAALAFVVYTGGMQVINGEKTQGELFAFLAALLMLYEPVKRLNTMNSTLQGGLVAAERVFTLLDLAPEITDRPGAEKLPRVRGEVHLEGVRFRYQEAFVLDGIELRVRPGETVALVGGSGGGKSTLVNLIPRFYDVTEGAVRVDGHDVRDVTQASLRRNIALVAQETILFDDTVRANIAYGRPEATEEQVLSAARAAYIHEVVEAMPHRYETLVGTSGIKLSGGQRQRLAIARAILADAPILILDEATSALDNESEAIVQKALENLMRGRTVFVIAHRLSTVQNADRILVLVKGKVVEEGTHARLLEAGGEYSRLYRMSFRDEPAAGNGAGGAFD